jgi:hypothetical protein
MSLRATRGRLLLLLILLAAAAPADPASAPDVAVGHVSADAANNDHQLRAVDLESGVLEWSIRLGHDFRAYDPGTAPAAGDGLLLVPVSGPLIVFESAGL